MKCDYQGTHHLEAEPGDKIICPTCGRSVIVMHGHGDKLLIPAHQWPENIKVLHYGYHTRGTQ